MKAKISLDVCELPDEDVRFLERIGLSDHEIQTYQIIAQSEKPTSAQDVASKLMVYPSAVYRMFDDLEEKGLIYRLSGRPRTYRAAKRQVGYPKAYQSEVSCLERLLSATGINSEKSAGTDVVVGRQANYQEYIRLAKGAEHEICIFAIGIAYSEKLRKVQADAIRRGVYIRHVVQKLQSSNFHIIHKWQRLGVNMRVLKQEQGYHVVVVDRQKALVTFSDPENTDDRVAIVTETPSAVRLFQAQFESIWSQAQRIEKT